MKTQLVYSSGWMLIIPKDGLAPMLFLEWLSGKRAGYGIVHVVLNDTDGVRPGCFRIRLNTLKESYIEAKEYINANLPIESIHK